MSAQAIAVATLKRLVPRPVKRLVWNVWRALVLRLAVKELLALGPDADTPRALLERLSAGWGNASHAARIGYLEEIVSRVRASKGPILECGSGLSTIILGAVAGSRGREVFSLEHSPEWGQRLARTIKQNGVPGVQLCHCPLKDYGRFSWYDVSGVRMPSQFSLVICDGPPGGIHGGRYGLLPVMLDRIPAGTCILVDDANREGEQDVLRRWQELVVLEIEPGSRSTGEYVVAFRR